jgi:hypothetical protein
MGNAALTWDVREDAQLIKWEKGDVIEGVLLGIVKKTLDNKPALEYKVDAAGKLVKFWGAYQLNEKLRPSDVGHAVMISYIGEDTGVGRNGNKMRVFEVKVSKELVADTSLYITNDDFPF